MHDSVVDTQFLDGEYKHIYVQWLPNGECRWYTKPISEWVERD